MESNKVIECRGLVSVDLRSRILTQGKFLTGILRGSSLTRLLNSCVALGKEYKHL